MKKNAKIYISGHTGLAGSAIYRRLKSKGYTHLILRTHSELDLLKQEHVKEFFQNENPEYVFIAAAKVGGIAANSTFPAQFIYENLVIQTNILHNAWKSGVKRLIFLGSSCIYPRDCPQPIKEAYFFTGPLEPTNRPYATAKIAGIVQCESYNRQYGTLFLGVMPTNLYGPNDNYDLENSHVLPALMRKFHLAKLSEQGDWDSIKKDEISYGSIPSKIRTDLGISCSQDIKASLNGNVILWGTGRPYREFLYSDDLADACVFLMKLDEASFTSLVSGAAFSKDVNNNTGSDSDYYPLINIGCGHDQTISEIARKVATIVGFKGHINWDNLKPDGTPRKLLDVSALFELGWHPTIPLNEGLKTTYQSYLQHVRNNSSLDA